MPEDKEKKKVKFKTERAEEVYGELMKEIPPVYTRLLALAQDHPHLSWYERVASMMSVERLVFDMTASAIDTASRIDIMAGLSSAQLAMLFNSLPKDR